MELRKIPKIAVQVGSHWEWQEDSLTFHGWADENGYLHRESAPANIWYLKDGRTIWRESWYHHGQPHREGAPAEIWYHEDGRTIWRESWWLHGQLHREGAPAWIKYREDGTIEREFWWLQGQETEALYHKEAYEDLQKGIGRPAMWALSGNLIRLLSGFF